MNASLIKRLLAFIGDLLIINLIILEPFRKIIIDSIPQGDFFEVFKLLSENDIVLGKLYASSIFIGVIALLYFSVMEWKLGQTIGKMLFGIYVVPVSEESTIKENNKISFLQSIVRNMYLIPLFPFFILIIIDPIYMFFNKTNQRLSEKMSGTFVVEVITWNGQNQN